jgi:hypothetical protein
MKTSRVFSAILLTTLGSAAQAAPFTVSADGAEVSDAKTGLIWRRCAEGMTPALVGSVIDCTGTPSTITHEAALVRARDQASSTGVAWRLPNVKELASIVDWSKSYPAIDTVAFPSTPLDYFWSSSPSVSIPGSAWVVGFLTGGVYGEAGGYRYHSLPVRLVRAGK